MRNIPKNRQIWHQHLIDLIEQELVPADYLVVDKTGAVLTTAPLFRFLLIDPSGQTPPQSAMRARSLIREYERLYNAGGAAFYDLATGASVPVRYRCTIAEAA